MWYCSQRKKWRLDVSFKTEKRYQKLNEMERILISKKDKHGTFTGFLKAFCLFTNNSVFAIDWISAMRIKQKLFSVQKIICITAISVKKIKYKLHVSKLHESVWIWSFSGPYLPADGLINSVSLRIQSKCGKTLTRKTPNSDVFHAVSVLVSVSVSCSK